MTDPHLPAEHAGQTIRWEPWQERAVCGRIPVPTECRLCGQTSPQHRTLGRVDGSVRASAERCTLCGGVRAYWRDDPAPGEARGRVVLMGRAPVQGPCDEGIDKPQQDEETPA